MRNKKSKNDKFYTKDKIVDLCLGHLGDIEKYKSIIEPAAGDGAFSNKLKGLFFDIEPAGDGIERIDFLKLNFLKYNLTKPILVIGNPPFGVQNSLCLKFIKKSAIIADTIAFILPKSFKKRSLQDKVPLNFHLVDCIDIPKNSFLLNGMNYDVPTVFQVWEKSNIKRIKERKLIPRTFKFVKKNDNPDLSFRRVGVYAGKASKEIEKKSFQSHYFIKVEGNVERFIEKVNKIEWDHNNTTGPRSISKQELIRKIE